MLPLPALGETTTSKRGRMRDAGAWANGGAGRRAGAMATANSNPGRGPVVTAGRRASLGADGVGALGLINPYQGKRGALKPKPHAKNQIGKYYAKILGEGYYSIHHQVWRCQGRKDLGQAKSEYPEVLNDLGLGRLGDGQALWGQIDNRIFHCPTT